MSLFNFESNFTSHDGDDDDWGLRAPQQLKIFGAHLPMMDRLRYAKGNLTL